MSAASTALDRLRAAARATADAIARGPRAAIAWVRREPSRALAYVWLAGLVSFAWITYRRAYRKHQIESAQAAAVAATLPHKPKRAPEVIQMMDVDDLDQTRIDRMHELGLAAAGEDHAPDQKTIEAARAARTKAVVAEGEQVYGDDDVVVVSKGGIAGWIARNRDKKPDPETLAWLRGEEKKDGIKAYASWADDGKGDGIAGWLARRSSPSEAVPNSDARLPTPDSKREQTTEPKPTLEAAPVVDKVVAVPAGKEFDIALMGTAMLAVLDPAVRVHRGEPLDSDVDAMRLQLAAAGAVGVAIRNHHLVISLAHVAEDTAEGRARLREVARALAELPDQDYLLATGDPERTMAVAVQLAVGGLATDRIVIGATPPADETAIEIVLLSGGAPR